MTRETMTETEINNLVNEIRGAIMSHIGKNNAKLREAAVTLDSFGYALGDTKETRKLMIWNEYLKMELERITKVPQEVRMSKMLQMPKAKVDHSAAITAFLSAKK